MSERPNIILLHVGTNDKNLSNGISTKGNDSRGAIERLRNLIDQMWEACPNAVILVAVITNTCNQDQSSRTDQFQEPIPGIVQSRLDSGKDIVAVNLSTFLTSDLRDSIHLTNAGYAMFDNYWYDFVT